MGEAEVKKSEGCDSMARTGMAWKGLGRDGYDGLREGGSKVR